MPFPPGGAIDVIARTMANAMTKTLGQAIVVDNRPGAGGNPDVEKTFRTNGVQAYPMSPQEFARFVDREIIKWGRVVNEAKITLD